MFRRLLLVLTLLTFAAPGWVLPEEPFAWQTDLEAARALAAREGKPLLVVFR